MASSIDRRDVLKWIGGALAMVLLQPLASLAAEPIKQSPWLVSAVVLPLGAAVWLLGRPIYRNRRVLLGGGFFGFFFAFCLLFWIAAESDLLSGPRREIRGYEDAVPSNPLGLGRLGDWRYKLAPAAPATTDLLVLIDSSAGEIASFRRNFAFLVKEAQAKGAKGIAFDFFLERPGDPAFIDRFLCRQLESARESGTPVFFGYRHDVEVSPDGYEYVQRVDLPESLRDCLPDEQLGSLAGYREADGIVRLAPLYLRGDQSLQSLSLRAARVLAAAEDLDLPEDGLVRFVPPARKPAPIHGWPTGDETDLFSGRFVFVGAIGQDLHETPFGEVAGVQIHAWSAHALSTGAFLRRADPRWSFAGLFAAFYALTLVQARGGGRRKLLAAAVVLSLAFAVAAILAVRFGRLWIDVAYPWIGLWTLTAFLSGGAALQAGRRRAEADLREAETETSDGEPAAPPGPKDVFLSHNSKQKPQVRKLAEALQARGLEVWLDEWELTPGRSWQEELEEAITTVRSAAVLVGEAGLGPWEIPEMRSCISECVDRSMPVIPVLLPGAAEKPELPLFLRNFTWVDLRDGLSPAGLDRLEWGITGVKPKRKR